MGRSIGCAVGVKAIAISPLKVGMSGVADKFGDVSD